MTNDVSHIQKQFYINHMLYPKIPAYNIGSVFKVEGELNTELLEQAINIVFVRYDILRSTFKRAGSQITQSVIGIDEFPLQIEMENVPTNFAKNVGKEVTDEVNRPFNLANWPLCRVKLFQYNNSISVLTFTFHHIIIDLYSKTVFSKEVSHIYNQLQTEKVDDKSTIRKKYSSYVSAEKKWLSSEESKKSILFWNSILSDVNFELNLPTDYSRPTICTKQGKRYPFSFDEVISSKLQDYAKLNTLKVFTVLLGAFSILCKELSKQNSFTIGVPMSNRRTGVNKEMFGPVLNIVPIPLNFSRYENEVEVLKDIRKNLLFAHRNQELPYTHLLKHLEFEKGFAKNPIFQVGFTEEPPMSLNLEGVKIKPVDFVRDGAQLDLFLTFWYSENKFHAYLEYSVDLFEESTILDWINKYKSIVNKVIT